MHALPALKHAALRTSETEGPGRHGRLLLDHRPAVRARALMEIAEARITDEEVQALRQAIADLGATCGARPAGRMRWSC